MDINQDNNFEAAINDNEDTNLIYVANWDSGTVSVISGENNTKIKDIEADDPFSTAVNEDTNTVYVGNEMTNTVSVISG
jgi:YVTN family beta-propeller protein